MANSSSIETVVQRNSKGEEIQVPSDKVGRLKKLTKENLIALIHQMDLNRSKMVERGRELRARVVELEGSGAASRPEVVDLTSNPVVQAVMMLAGQTAQPSTRHGNTKCDNPTCRGGKATARCEADGTCIRCGGKGHQDDDDRRRNWGYDHNNANGVHTHA